MLPWVALDSAPTPEGGLMRLLRRGTEFSIRIDGNELMNSRLSGSERRWRIWPSPGWARAPRRTC